MNDWGCISVVKCLPSPRFDQQQKQYAHTHTHTHTPHETVSSASL
jgi:hypothetical protein